MRSLTILLSLGLLVSLTGCKYPDNAELHPHVQNHVGGTVEWHPHVKAHYSALESWAQGSSCCPAGSASEPVAKAQ